MPIRIDSMGKPGMFLCPCPVYDAAVLAGTVPMDSEVRLGPDGETIVPYVPALTESYL